MKSITKCRVIASVHVEQVWGAFEKRKGVKDKWREYFDDLDIKHDMEAELHSLEVERVWSKIEK